jgi:hypothetical protein
MRGTHNPDRVDRVPAHYRPPDRVSIRHQDTALPLRNGTIAVAVVRLCALAWLVLSSDDAAITAGPSRNTPTV